MGRVDRAGPQAHRGGQHEPEHQVGRPDRECRADPRRDQHDAVPGGGEEPPLGDGHRLVARTLAGVLPRGSAPDARAPARPSTRGGQHREDRAHVGRGAEPHRPLRRRGVQEQARGGDQHRNREEGADGVEGRAAQREERERGRHEEDPDRARRSRTSVIPVPTVASSSSTPYPTQTCTRVDRDAASTASTVGTSGQANSTIRPSRLRGPISTRPAVSHTAPSTRPKASPADDVGGDGGVQATAGAPPRVVRRSGPTGGPVRRVEHDHRCGPGASGTSRQAHRPGRARPRPAGASPCCAPSGRRPGGGTTDTSRDSAGVTTTVAIIAASSRPSGSGGCGAIVRRLLLRCRAEADAGPRGRATVETR